MGKRAQQPTHVQTATAVQMQDAVIRRMEALRVLAMLDILEMELHVQTSTNAPLGHTVVHQMLIVPIQ